VLDGAYPSYFVYGPLVFSTATQEYLREPVAGGKRAVDPEAGQFGQPAGQSRNTDLQAFEGERLVVVSSPFFPHKLAQGYSNPVSEVVKSVNGISDQEPESSGGSPARLPR
jgi:hypothetical protein